jgi:hypothetical protein
LAALSCFGVSSSSLLKNSPGKGTGPTEFGDFLEIMWAACPYAAFPRYFNRRLVS